MEREISFFVNLVIKIAVPGNFPGDHSNWRLVIVFAVRSLVTGIMYLIGQKIEWFFSFLF